MGDVNNAENNQEIETIPILQIDGTDAIDRIAVLKKTIEDKELTAKTS